MKLTFINNDLIKNAAKKGKLILAAGTIAFTLAACDREIATNSNVQYDVIDTSDEELVTSGIEQVIDVPGEDFQLIVNYRCVLEENAKWTITSDKKMDMKIHTSGLDSNTSVYIDNVHIDTTIRSVYPSVDGITQDTMDDRIHNSQMIGFPISDTNTYSNVNSIEGQNQTFMQGSFHGFNGYSNGTITEHRYVESDYLKAGVYANKINSIIDLIIVKPDDTVTCVSVPSTIGVSVWPYIEIRKNGGESIYRYYYYNETVGDIEYKELSPEEYKATIEKGRQYTK